MSRWITGSIVALLIGPLVSASRVPATQPSGIDVGKIEDFQRQLGQIQDELNAAKSRLDELSKLPPIQPWQPEGVVPMQPGLKGQFEIKPYGTSFKFNGVMVFVEPVGAIGKP